MSRYLVIAGSFDHENGRLLVNFRGQKILRACKIISLSLVTEKISVLKSNILFLVKTELADDTMEVIDFNSDPDTEQLLPMQPDSGTNVVSLQQPHSSNGKSLFLYYIAVKAFHWNYLN